MTLMYIPFTVQGIFTTTVLALLAFPVLSVSTAMMLLDKTLGTGFFVPAMVSMEQQLSHSGDSPLLFQHLSQFFGRPGVYIVVLPAFSIVSNLINTHICKSIFGYRIMVWAILIIGVLSFVAWAYRMFVASMNLYFEFFFATTTFVIAIPTVLRIYNWVLTLWRDDIHPTVPMLFVTGLISAFVVGGLTGLFLDNVSVDIPLSSMYLMVTRFHVVMGVSPILVVFGGLYHWYPKVIGRMPNDTLERAHFWITFIGTYPICFPVHYLNMFGVPHRYHAYESYSFTPPSAQTLSTFIAVIAVIIGLAQLSFLFNLAWDLVRGGRVEVSPWRATAFGWQTPQTPPVHGNWGPALPVVYRWAYEYNLPGCADDSMPQSEPPADTPDMGTGTEAAPVTSIPPASRVHT